MKTTERNKTFFILDTHTGEVLRQIITKESVNIPWTFKIEFNILKKKLSTVVAKQWIEGEEKTTIILR